jgi:asparagine synthase (glutamine-hydrolysing)
VIHGFNRADHPVSRRLARSLHSLGAGLLPRRLGRGLELLAHPEAERFQALRSFMGSSDRALLYHEDFLRQLAVGAEEYLCGLYDHSLPCDLDRAFGADFVSYLPEDLLVKVDRASMAHGLECRSPFLDQELVEFACSLPARWKIDGQRSKRILKDAAASWFPQGFLDRPKKGFTVPVGKWFRGELKHFIEDAIINGPLGRMPLFQRGSLERVLREHFDGSRDHETRIWNLLMLSLWFEEYGACA